MSVYYIRHLHIHIMLKNVKNTLKFYPLRTKNKIIFFYEDENIQFNFIGTKIKIRYIYRDEKHI